MYIDEGYLLVHWATLGGQCSTAILFDGRRYRLWFSVGGNCIYRLVEDYKHRLSIVVLEQCDDIDWDDDADGDEYIVMMAPMVNMVMPLIRDSHAGACRC